MANEERKVKENEYMIEHFIGELENQCKYVFVSMDILEDALSTYKDTFMVFYALHNTFTALGNISKILFPKKGYEARGAKLRSILNVGNNSQFHFNTSRNVVRKYRNILEHYDEKFESWFKESYSGTIIDNNVGDKEIIPMIRKDAKCLRHYDNIRNTFIFLDEEYDIKPVINETRQIYERIRKIKK